jgi:histone deacetylase 11
VALVYSKRFEINLAGLERSHPFDVHKYSKIAKQLVNDGLVSAGDFHVPDELSRDQMLLVHTPEYLESLKSSTAVATYLEAPIAAILPGTLIDRSVLRAFRHASGGTILAGRLALKHAVAVNVGGGYHHAKPGGGEGFCIYADMPIAIRLLQQEKLIRRALVVDLDVHQGNGTAVCFRGDDSVFTFSMHQADIYPIPKEQSDCDVELEPGTDDETYLRILRRVLPGVIDRSRPELVMLQAGCDTLAGDPLADLCMTQEGIVARDGYVADTCARRGIPLAVTLGGGYSRQAWKVQHASICRILENQRPIG